MHPEMLLNMSYFDPRKQELKRVGTYKQEVEHGLATPLFPQLHDCRWMRLFCKATRTQKGCQESKKIPDPITISSLISSFLASPLQNTRTGHHWPQLPLNLTDSTLRPHLPTPGKKLKSSNEDGSKGHWTWAIAESAEWSPCLRLSSRNVCEPCVLVAYQNGSK